MTIRSVLIANRGEIAVRIIRAAKALGIRTVQVHSAADAEMLAVKLADEAINIGSPAPKKSYLNIEADHRRSQIGRCRCRSSRLRLSVRKRRFRRCRRGGRHDLHRPKRRCDPPARRQGRRSRSGRTRRCADSAGKRRPRVSISMRPQSIADAHRLSCDDQGRGRRRRPRHPHRPVAGRARAAVSAGFGGSGCRLRRWRPLHGEGHHPRAPYRGADFRRRREFRSLLRARMLAAAPPPEGVGRSARPSCSRRMCENASAPVPWRSRARSSIAVPARSNIFTTKTVASSTSSRSTPASRSSIRLRK